MALTQDMIREASDDDLTNLHDWLREELRTRAEQAVIEALKDALAGELPRSMPVDEITQVTFPTKEIRDGTYRYTAHETLVELRDGRSIRIDVPSLAVLVWNLSVAEVDYVNTPLFDDNFCEFDIESGTVRHL